MIIPWGKYNGKNISDLPTNYLKYLVEDCDWTGIKGIQKESKKELKHRGYKQQVSMKKKIDVECPDCHGTGIYHGFYQQKGIGIICGGCQGTGCQRIHYIPFKSIKKRTDIKTIILFDSIKNKIISYDQWFKKK